MLSATFCPIQWHNNARTSEVTTAFDRSLMARIHVLKTLSFVASNCQRNTNRTNNIRSLALATRGRMGAHCNEHITRFSSIYDHVSCNRHCSAIQILMLVALLIRTCDGSTSPDGAAITAYVSKCQCISESMLWREYISTRCDNLSYYLQYSSSASEWKALPQHA